MTARKKSVYMYTCTDIGATSFSVQHLSTPRMNSITEVWDVWGAPRVWVSLRIPYQMHVGGKKLGLTPLFDWKLLSELQRLFQFIIEITRWHVGHWQPCISCGSKDFTEVVWDHYNETNENRCEVTPLLHIMREWRNCQKGMAVNEK